MPKEKLLIPTKYAERLEEILEKVWDLPDELWEYFWLKTLNSMEAAVLALKSPLKEEYVTLGKIREENRERNRVI